MYLKQLGITSSVCGPFTKNKERIEKCKETGDSRHIYQIELDNGCFQHDVAYGYFKDLNRRTVMDKALRGKAFNILKNLKRDGYQRGLASTVYKFFDQKTFGGTVNNEIISDKELAERLHKPISKKFEKRKVHSPFLDNI